MKRRNFPYCLSVFRPFSKKKVNNVIIMAQRMDGSNESRDCVSCSFVKSVA